MARASQAHEVRQESAHPESGHQDSPRSGQQPSSQRRRPTTFGHRAFRGGAVPERAAPVIVTSVPDCLHHWVIATPAPGQSSLPATCRRCGGTRQFAALGSWWIGSDDPTSGIRLDRPQDEWRPADEV